MHEAPTQIPDGIRGKKAENLCIFANQSLPAYKDSFFLAYSENITMERSKVDRESGDGR